MVVVKGGAEAVPGVGEAVCERSVGELGLQTEQAGAHGRGLGSGCVLAEEVVDAGFESLADEGCGGAGPKTVVGAARLGDEAVCGVEELVGGHGWVSGRGRGCRGAAFGLERVGGIVVQARDST